jgi:O-antigen ligase
MKFFMFKNLNFEKTFQFLLIILAFLMPLTVFGSNLIIVIICVLWLFSGNYKSKFDQIINNKLILASIIFYCIHLLGLLWTEDISWGLHILHKMWYFIGLFPILYTIVRKDFISKYIFAFLLAISLTEVCSYLVWFEVIKPFKNATVLNPTPFMSHISYNPILAFSIYFVLHEIFFNRKISNLLFTLYTFFAISMSINMFITGGRAGQVMYFAMLSIIIFQFFNTQKIKALLIVSFLIPGIFLTAYSTSDLFQQRVDAAVKNTIYYSDQKNTSVGQRITYAINSWEVIKENPIIGVGTGDFPVEYKKINKKNTPKMPNATNPHNMYTLIAFELGSIGIISMLSIFYYQIKLSFSAPDKYIRDIGITLPLLFLVTMWSDSYLLGHFTTLVFVFFSSFLYKDFEKY